MGEVVGAIVVVLLLVGGGVVVAGIVYGIVVLFKRAAERERQRLLTWAAFAADRGLTFEPGRNRELAQSFEFLNRLGRGKDQYAENVFSGSFDGYSRFAFTYHYETQDYNHQDNSWEDDDHWLKVVSIQVASGTKQFPELTVHFENMLSRFADIFGGGDIDFESEEFSRQFRVGCSDRQFAHDFFHPEMMSHFMTYPAAIELEGQWLSMISYGRIDIADIDSTFAHLDSIARLMPGALYS